MQKLRIVNHPSSAKTSCLDYSLHFNENFFVAVKTSFIIIFNFIYEIVTALGFLATLIDCEDMAIYFIVKINIRKIIASVIHGCATT